MRIILELICKYKRKYSKGRKNIDKEINTKEELAITAFISRNSEVFRIIYMNGKKIVGHEILLESNLENNYCRKLMLKIIEKMYVLSSDSFYIAKSNSKINLKLYIVVIKFFKNIKGFKGIITVDKGKYAYIEINKKNKVVLKKNIEIINYNINSFNKYMENTPVINFSINSKNDLAKIILYLNYESKFSTLIILDKYKIKFIQEIHNYFFELRKEQIYGYIKNRIKENKGSKVLIATTDEKVYNSSNELIKENIIDEIVAYNHIGDKIYIFNYNKYERE